MDYLQQLIGRDQITAFASFRLRQGGAGGQAIAFGGPGAEVCVLAALAAKRAEWVLWRVDAIALAAGAGDDAALWR